MSLASASSSRCNRAEISTGCTSPLKARAKIPFTAPSTFFSKRVRMPIPLLPQATLDGIRRPYRPVDLQVRAADCECPLQLCPADRAAVRASLSGWIAQHARPSARVAERQTRWLQVPVSARTWGFKSPLAHQYVPRPDLGLYGVRGRLKGPIVAPLWHRLSSEALLWACCGAMGAVEPPPGWPRDAAPARPLAPSGVRA